MKLKKQSKLRSKRHNRAWTLATRLEKRKIKNKKFKKAMRTLFSSSTFAPYWSSVK